MNADARAEPAGGFKIQIEQVEGYKLVARFDKDQYTSLEMDEPPPLGADSAPNPARILAAAIGDCLSASLIFCAKRAGVVLEGVRTEVDVELVRNARKRLRIGRVEVKIDPGATGAAALSSCLEAFEDFCVVTQSVREGIDVQVKVQG